MSGNDRSDQKNVLKLLYGILNCTILIAVTLLYLAYY